MTCKILTKVEVVFIEIMQCIMFSFLDSYPKIIIKVGELRTIAFPRNLTFAMKTHFILAFCATEVSYS